MFVSLQSGNLHGYGQYQWAEGRVYDGNWQHSKMHGKGRYFFPDGKYMKATT